MAGLIGIFGGTFDPPHLGHLILADQALNGLGERLEKILWVVAADPPHKPDEPLSPVDQRVAMVQAAIAGNPDFEISFADIQRPGPHYSVDLLRLLRDETPRARFAFLMGADSLQDLPQWHQPQTFVEACNLIGVMPRQSIQPDLAALDWRFPGVARKVRFIQVPLIGLSSTAIRSRVRAGDSYRYMVPPGVAEIIQQQELYLERLT